MAVRLLLLANSLTSYSSFLCERRGVWIQEEKELLQEVAGMGELEEPWHSKQVQLLDRHLHLLHLYSQASENLAAHKGRLSVLLSIGYILA